MESKSTVGNADRHCDRCGEYVGYLDAVAWRHFREPDGQYVCASCWDDLHPEHIEYDRVEVEA